jgi:putative transposase
MKQLKLSEAKIVTMLKESEAGTKAEELCRKYSISSSTFYTLKAQYTGMDVSHLKRLKELEVENNRLKKMYANAGIEIEALKDVIEKKLGG